MNPFQKNNMFSTPTFDELAEIFQSCKSPGEAVMIAGMVWNLAHEVYASECTDRVNIPVRYKAGRRNSKTAGMLSKGL